MTTESTSTDDAARRDGSRLSEGLGLAPERAAFERYFAGSRKSKGANRRPNFDRLQDGTYADDHTQRHWWTWQQAQAAERERFRAPLLAFAADLRACVPILSEHGMAETAAEFAKGAAELEALLQGPNVF